MYMPLKYVKKRVKRKEDDRVVYIFKIWDEITDLNKIDY